MRLHIPDPADGGDAKTEAAPKTPSPAKPPAEPKSPAIVKKTPLVTPREIALEKTVSRLEDRVKTVEDGIGGINSWLEKVFPGGKAPAKAVPVEFQAETTAARKASANGIDVDIWGKA